jgi:hypothetical protein
MPKAYIIARIDVTDPERYAKYVAVTPGVVARFGGRFLARGGRFEARKAPPAPATSSSSSPTSTARSGSMTMRNIAACFRTPSPVRTASW